MKISYLLLIPLFLLCFCACDCRDAVTLNVKVNGKPSDSLVHLYTTDSVYTVPLNESSTAEIIVPKGKKLGYAYLKYGFKKSFVYLEPGVNISLILDVGKYEVKQSFLGVNSKKNEYLNQHCVKFFTANMELEETDFIASLEKTEKKLWSSLDSLSFDKEFVEKEKVRLHNLIYSHLLSYPEYRNAIFNDRDYKCSEYYYNCLDASFKRNDAMLDVPGYIENIGNYVAQIAQKDMVVFDFEGFVNNCMKLATDYIPEPSLLQNFIHPIVMEYIGAAGISKLDEFKEYYQKNLFSQIVIAELEKEGKKWMKLSKGEPAPDFEFQNLQGKTFRLKDFRGKYLFLDIWTTWCGPCRKQMPYLEQIKDKMKGKNIVFLTVSSDEDIQKWKDALKKMNLKGWQLHVDTKSTFYKDYLITVIPRFILLDKEGRIFNASVSEPSNPKTLEFLNSLEGI